MNEIMEAENAKKIENQMKEEANRMERSKANANGRINIMVVGRTGVGKSTLINALFGIKVAEVGVGKPITTKITAYRKGNLKVYDTAGIEMDKEKTRQYSRECVDLINNLLTQGVEEQIHLIIYCVYPLRLEDVEMDFIKEISKSNIFNRDSLGIPVLIVNPRTVGMKDSELSEFYNKCVIPQFKKCFPYNKDYSVHEVQAFGYTSKGYTVEKFGVEELEEAIYAQFDETMKVAILRNFHGNIALKKKQAENIAATYIAIASGTALGGTVIGIDDSVALLGLELSMCAQIGSIFNFELDEDRVKAMVEASLKTVAVAAVAKTAGHWVMAIATLGGSLAIEAAGRVAIAGVTVHALSVFYIDTMVKYASGELDDEAVTKMLIEKLKNK